MRLLKTLRTGEIPFYILLSCNSATRPSKSLYSLAVRVFAFISSLFSHFGVVTFLDVPEDAAATVVVTVRFGTHLVYSDRRGIG